MKQETMRSLKIRTLLRVLDTGASVLSILALVLIYNRLTENRNVNESNSFEWKPTQEASKTPLPLQNDPAYSHGKLAVQVWSGICGGKLSHLFKSPFFPRFFDESYFISQTRAGLNKSNHGQRIYGFLHPPETGYYKFVLYSDDGSEFWFGANGSLTSLKLAASVASREKSGRAPVGEIRFNSQISEDFLLEKGNKYPMEIIHLQGTDTGFVELHWIRPGKHFLEVITSEYISHFTNLQLVSQTAISKVESESQSSVTKPYLVTFLTDSTVDRTLPVCSYTLPASTKPDVPRFHSYKAIKEVTMVASETDKDWRKNTEAKEVVDLFMAGLEKIFPKKYTVARLLNLERVPTEEENNSVLYFLGVELGCDALDYTERVAEYVYLQRDQQEQSVTKKAAQLCYPKGLGWRKEVPVHLIIAVDHEGQRLHRFIEKIERIFEDSLEVDFHLVIVHSGKTGLDIERILQGTSLQKYKIKQLDEKFSWTRAVNSGVKLVQDPQSIILTSDVHMDLPASIFEDCRKHCVEGKMTFAPFFYALGCGAYPEKPQGSWHNHGYQMIGMFKKDWERIGGMDESVKDELAAWDLVDRILSNGLHVARMKSPNLFRLFNPELRN
ncbi:hypothetical protein ACROYT_G029224 [Oculina patagonica]